ncbi:MAG: quinone oxidoreductase [Proteobacteria bacterium]|nr:quinone oxidoreductase [Pseudomonadota bacterium]
MKAIRIHKTGGPDVLTLEDITLAPPGPHEVRIRHTVIGVNFLDIYHRSGLYPLPLPSGIGSEAAGVVELAGDNVADLKPGDRVAYTGVVGSYAQEANVPAARTVKLPDSISDEIAAGSLLKGLTAHYLLRWLYPVKSGETILVHAAAGGVGLILCQWAKHLGVTVIGTVGSDDKLALAKANGCTHVLNARKENIASRVRELTGGDGVSVVYDSVGKDSFAASLDSLRVRGTMVSFGNASGPVPPLELKILTAKGSLFLTRPTLMHYTRDAQETQTGADALFALIKDGAVKITVNQRFALSDARAAHEALHSRKTIGATVLTP